MNTQHTPGPWAVEVINGAVHSIYTTKPNPEVLEYSRAEIIVETDSGFYPPKLADAYLIAAAPELLEASLEALELFAKIPELIEYMDTFYNLRNAINKAT